jgi:hypothetical protein
VGQVTIGFDGNHQRSGGNTITNNGLPQGFDSRAVRAA